MRQKKRFSSEVPTSVLLPGPLQRAIAERARLEERSFSAVIRRALIKEFGLKDEPEPQNGKHSK